MKISPVYTMPFSFHSGLGSAYTRELNTGEESRIELHSAM